MCVMILPEVMIQRFHYRYCNNELWIEKSLLSIWKIYARYVTKMKRKFINWTLRYAMTVGWSKLVQKFELFYWLQKLEINSGRSNFGAYSIPDNLRPLFRSYFLRWTYNSKIRESAECLNQVYLIEYSTVLTIQAKFMIGAFSFHRSTNQFGFLFFRNKVIPNWLWYTKEIVLLRISCPSENSVYDIY